MGQYGIRADVYEYNTVPGGRISTLRGYFADGQIVEEHAEFINPEHTATLALARQLRAPPRQHRQVPAGDPSRPGDHALSRQDMAAGRAQPGLARVGLEALPPCGVRDRSLAAAVQHHNAGGRRFDHMSVTEWIDTLHPRRGQSDFGAVCIAAVLDEYGGPADETSALNLVYLLGQDASTASGAQPHGEPQLAGADEKWHIHGGNDQLITGLLARLPRGVCISANGWSPSGRMRAAGTGAASSARARPATSRPITSCWPFRSPCSGRST